MQVGGFTYAGLSERDKALICLARLKRFDDAQRFALDFEHNSPSRNPIAMIYVHAAAGDVKQTLRLLQLFSKGDVGLRDFYRDENLGPVLRSDAMRAVRERFPEPAIGGKTVSK
jgi:hypothetical protein